MYSYLDDAIEAAESGATIMVCDGEFHSYVDFVRSISLKAEEGASPRFAGRFEVEVAEEVDWVVEIDGIDLEYLEVVFDQSGEFTLRDADVQGDTFGTPLEIWFKDAGGVARLEDVDVHDTGEPDGGWEAGLSIKFGHPDASVTVEDCDFSKTVNGIVIDSSTSGGRVDVVSSSIRNMSNTAFDLTAESSCDVSFHEVEISGCYGGIDLSSMGGPSAGQGEVNVSLSSLYVSDLTKSPVAIVPRADGIVFDVQIENSQIHDNQESAIWMEPNYAAVTQLHIESSSLHSNGGNYQDEAGALTLSNAVVTVVESELVNNAGQEGGAVLLRNDVQLHLESCVVQGNAAIYSDDCSGDQCLGGAIQFGGSSGDDSEVVITTTDFGSSSATENTPYDVATHQYTDSPAYPDPVDFVGVVSTTCVNFGECT